MCDALIFKRIAIQFMKQRPKPDLIQASANIWKSSSYSIKNLLYELGHRVSTHRALTKTMRFVCHSTPTPEVAANFSFAFQFSNDFHKFECVNYVFPGYDFKENMQLVFYLVDNINLVDRALIKVELQDAIDNGNLRCRRVPDGVDFDIDFADVKRHPKFDLY